MCLHFLNDSQNLINTSNQTRMEFYMNIDKTAISTKVMEFLEINLTQEEDKNTCIDRVRLNHQT